jgi:SUMO ligase MMS21 Smc5/6 complex component
MSEFINSFAVDEFDPKQWVNDMTRNLSTRDNVDGEQQQLDDHVSQLIVNLQLASAEVNAQYSHIIILYELKF